MQRISKEVVKEFEKTQKEYGTKVAIHNLIWVVASDLFKSIGIKKIKTS